MVMKRSKLRLVATALVALLAGPLAAQTAPDRPAAPAAHEPPPQAYEDCKGKAAGDVVQHQTPDGKVAAVCAETPHGLAARPQQPPPGAKGAAPGAPPGSPPGGASSAPPPGERPAGGAQAYSIEQAVTDGAQLHTIAFNGLAFITGGFGASTFMPPGKVSDFFGFQYMRDIDAAGKGHNPQFLDRVAGNVLSILNDDQRALFEREAHAEAPLLRDIALRRLPLIAAFHQQLAGQLPAGSAGLDQASVVRFGGETFAADAALAYRRAEVYGRISSSLNDGQKAALGRMHFGDFASWPAVDMESHKLGRGTEPLVNIAYMTLASEYFSWYAGSPEADT